MTTTTQCAVLGSGVIGASIAYHLAKAGARVVLIDAAEPAVAPSASWASAGGLRSQGRHGPEQAISIMAAARWRTLEQELDADLGVLLGGHLHVAETEAEEAAVLARVQADRDAGIAIEQVGAREIREIAPDLSAHLRLGAWTPDDGQANPARVAQAFARAAERHGAACLLRSPAQPLVELGRVTGLLLPSGETLRPEHVILAAGAWSIGWLREIGCTLPLRWRGLQMLLSDASPARVSPTVTAVGRNLSLKQSPSGGIIIGGRWFARPVGAAPAVEPIEDHVLRQWAGATAILPDLRNRVLQRSWAGAEAQTLDSMPFIGSLGETGVYLATGFSNHGFQVSPMIGALVADDLLGQKQDLLNPFRPERSGVPDDAWFRFEREPFRN
ncbi:FAD-binding oxidoreductase (plasmid) [Lichenicola cladoniae]|uniref:FAD-binding oxidoreductase n=1 Tax=Lichenicola cladoniae TaxID=1484109 RepID=A0A6M8HY72_9PROT|nr:FAD-dependent oxidoreductase [Lichenicola cladoniae]NPD68659.1 FAD-binding oxidoreductase [Acetobacteraceae bacterium]QKE93041.1 FAD-binding oxidoreductase [Lichenicola cladoniae]